MSFEITTWLLIDAFLIAAVLGAVANKTNFCTMGAISDWVNMGNTARLSAWLFAIAVAITGVVLLEYTAQADLTSSLPPYRTANFAWLRYLLGGLLFGIGMTLAGGCGNKTLINIGGGSLRSVFVLLVSGVMAYLMTKTSFYEIVFHSWIQGSAIDLTALNIKSQALPDLFAGLLGVEVSSFFKLFVSITAIAGFLFLALRCQDFRKNTTLMLGGLVVGLCIVAGWYVSGGPIGQEAIEVVEWLDERPLSVGVQSFTFINPMGDTVNFLLEPTNSLLITFGMMSLLGVITGSLIISLINGNFRISTFISVQDFLKHLMGGILMGIGGVLAMGCSLGQGITGVSTLALGSILALITIMFGSAITIKVSYYKMMYEDENEGGFFAYLLSALVDFRMLPESFRQLDEP